MLNETRVQRFFLYQPQQISSSSGSVLASLLTQSIAHRTLCNAPSSAGALQQIPAEEYRFVVVGDIHPRRDIVSDNNFGRLQDIDG
jgi:hypothetical protein